MKNIYKQFILRNVRIRNIADQIYGWPNNTPKWQFRYLSYTLVSETWQAWCLFCRAVILKSCQGAVTRSGNLVNPRTTENSWQRIAYEIQQHAKGLTPRARSRVRFQRHEPTWGDQNLLLRAIPGLAPHNSASLISGFGLSLNGPRHLQHVRNACAHLTPESINQVKNLTIYYRGASLSDPIDILWWIDPTTQTDAFYQWLDDMEAIAGIVTA